MAVVWAVAGAGAAGAAVAAVAGATSGRDPVVVGDGGAAVVGATGSIKPQLRPPSRPDVRPSGLDAVAVEVVTAATAVPGARER